MREAQVPGQGEWRKAQIETSPDFHLENKVDDVEKLVEKVGWEDAIEQTRIELNEDPDNQEKRRRATLVVELFDKKIKPLRDQLQH